MRRGRSFNLLFYCSALNSLVCCRCRSLASPSASLELSFKMQVHSITPPCARSIHHNINPLATPTTVVDNKNNTRNRLEKNVVSVMKCKRECAGVRRQGRREVGGGRENNRRELEEEAGVMSVGEEK